MDFPRPTLGTSPFLLDHPMVQRPTTISRFRGSAHLSHLRTQKTLEQLGAAASLGWNSWLNLLLRAVGSWFCVGCHLGSSCSWFLANVTHLAVFLGQQERFLWKNFLGCWKESLGQGFFGWFGLVWFVNGGGDRGVYNASLWKSYTAGSRGFLKRGKFGVEIVELVG